jgi:hypothetical protein
MDPSRWPRGTLYPQKLAITSLTSRGRSVGIVRSRTQTSTSCTVTHCNSVGSYRRFWRAFCLHRLGKMWSHKVLLLILSLLLWLFRPLLGLGRLFSLAYTQSVGLLVRGISLSQGLHLHTGQHKQNKRRQTSMYRVGLEPTTPVFEWTKTVHASGRTVSHKRQHFTF